MGISRDLKSILSVVFLAMSTFWLNNGRAETEMVEPHIILIHGLSFGGEMSDFADFLRAEGFRDITQESHTTDPERIAKNNHRTKAPTVLIGHSQGGFNVVKVAQAMIKQGERVDFVVTLAAGGAGRSLPGQWGFNPRSIPTGITDYWNFFSTVDSLGTDSKLQDNFAYAEDAKHPQAPHVTNHYYNNAQDVGHFALLECRKGHVHQYVSTLFCQPLVQQLKLLSK